MRSGERQRPLLRPAVFSSGFVRHVWRLVGLLPPDRLRRPAIKIRWLRLLSEDRHQPECRDQLAVVPCALPRYHHPLFCLFLSQSFQFVSGWSLASFVQTKPNRIKGKTQKPFTLCDAGLSIYSAPTLNIKLYIQVYIILHTWCSSGI